jgi:hypothetical protein
VAAATLESGKVVLEHVDLSLLLKLAHWLVLLGLGLRNGAADRSVLLFEVIPKTRHVLLDKGKQQEQDVVRELINV